MAGEDGNLGKKNGDAPTQYRKKSEIPVNKNLELEPDVGGKKASWKDGWHWAEKETVAYRGQCWRQKLG